MSKYDVPLIEDAAESLGSKYKGIASGSIGEYGIYSFNGNKIITTSGGGALISNNVAGIGRGQLEVLDDRVKARRANFKRYEEAFGSIKGIEFQPELKETYSNRWLTALTIDPKVTGVTRTEIIEKLEESNIEARPVWKPMHLQPLFEGYEYYPHEEDNSVSDALFESGLCLPSGSNMTQEQQEKVISIVKELLK